MLRAMEKTQLSGKILWSEKKKALSCTFTGKHKTPAKAAKQRLQIDLAGINLQDLDKKVSHCGSTAL